MNALATIRRLPGIFRSIERGTFLPAYSFHLRGRSGRLLGISGSSLCYPLKESENSRKLRDWILQVEDRRFYAHGALDFKGIIRALVKNLSERRISQGGSTITQQLARSIFLDTSRTWTRKLAETVIALKLEKHLSKDEILKAYCNFVYMGKGSRGFEAASRVIFRRPFGSLPTEKIPALVGLLGAPERFHPSVDESKFWRRADQKAKKLGVDIDVVPLNPIRFSRGSSRRFENIVREESSRLGMSVDGLKSVEITLDERLQKIIDLELRDVSCRRGVSELAAVVVDNRTGDVLAESAWRGGASSEFSPSFFGRIQPGSTFKTFALLSAFESGYSLDTNFISAPYKSKEDGVEWHVRNYGDEYRGDLTLGNALVQSDNTVFARLTDLLSIDQLASTYERFLQIDKSRFTRSAVLGGIHDGLSLLRITSAYSAVARNGIFIEPRIIRVFEYQDGTIQWRPLIESKAIADYSVIQQLKSALKFSAGKLGQLNFSGKTGTTEKGSLFVGYNEDVSVGLWLNFEHVQPENDPKSLTAVQIMKRIGHKMLAWSDERALAII